MGDLHGPAGGEDSNGRMRRVPADEGVPADLGDVHRADPAGPLLGSEHVGHLQQPHLLQARGAHHDPGAELHRQLHQQRLLPQAVHTCEGENREPCTGAARDGVRPACEAALTDHHAVGRVRADEACGLAGGAAPRGQGLARAAVRGVQVQAVDAAAPQHRLVPHGAGVAEIPCGSGP